MYWIYQAKISPRMADGRLYMRYGTWQLLGEGLRDFTQLTVELSLSSAKVFQKPPVIRCSRNSVKVLRDLADSASLRFVSIPAIVLKWDWTHGTSKMRQKTKHTSWEGHACGTGLRRELKWSSLSLASGVLQAVQDTQYRWRGYRGGRNQLSVSRVRQWELVPTIIWRLYDKADVRYAGLHAKSVVFQVFEFWVNNTC